MKINKRKSKEKLSDIDRIDIDPQQKASLLLFLFNQVPAVEIHIYQKNNAFWEITSLVTSLGLFLRVISYEGLESEDIIATLCIAHTEKDARQLYELKSLQQKPLLRSNNYHRRYGRLLGYPPTAINAYISASGGLLPRDKYPRDMIDNPLCTFYLSKSNYLQEAQIVRHWRQMVKKHSFETFVNLQLLVA